jgi:hypothetical protein
MAVTNEDIQNWFKANPNASDAEIFRVMQANKVSQEQLNAAMSFNPEEVGIRYTREQNSAIPPVVTPPVATAANTSQVGTGAKFTDDGRPIDTSFVSLSEYQNAKGVPKTDYKGLVYDAAGGSRITTPQGERYFSPYGAQPTKTELDWLMAQPTDAYLNSLAPMERAQKLQTWQKSRPGYVDPINFNTFEQYIAAANPNYKMRADAGNDLQNQANFYGLTIENYLNALKTGEGSAGNLTGSQLLSPLQRIAAETARAQGIAPMSPEVAALARANPDVFNAASTNWSNYLKSTFPGTLEYESALAGPMQFNATGVKMPTTSPANSMYFLDPVTKQITRNPNYKPTALAPPPTPVQLSTAPTTPGLIGTRPVGVKDGTPTVPATPGGSTGLFGAPVVNGRTQGLLGEIDNLPLGSYAGSIAPIQKSYESFMGIPAGAQFNPAITTEGQSPYKFLQKNWTDLKNVYEGQLPYTSMGGYNPALYVDLAKENKAMADITAAQAIQQQLDVLNAGGGDGGDGGGGGGGGGTGAGAGTGNAMAKGGLVTSLDGPNPPGPDDGSAYLDLGEYVIKKSSVNKYGKGLLDMINEGKVPAKKMKSLLG